jgi:hypothetical protein
LAHYLASPSKTVGIFFNLEVQLDVISKKKFKQNIKSNNENKTKNLDSLFSLKCGFIQAVLAVFFAGNRAFAIKAHRVLTNRTLVLFSAVFLTEVVVARHTGVRFIRKMFVTMKYRYTVSTALARRFTSAVDAESRRFGFSVCGLNASFAVKDVSPAKRFCARSSLANQF